MKPIWRRNVRLAVVVAVIGAVSWLTISRQHNRVERRTRFLMDTQCTIQVLGGNEAGRAAVRALDRMQALAIKLNALDPESPLHAFNREGSPVADGEVVELMETALRVSADSGGAFDVTVFPLVELWGFHGGSPRVPDPAEISGRLSQVGWRGLEISGNTLVKRCRAAAVDLGGIAKGYVVGAAAKLLQNAGVTAGLIDAGGDIFALGRPPDRSWKVGIRHPRSGGVLGVVRVADLAVFTSGDYERVFEQEAVRYHHVLDPRTGYPARGLASVTVVCPDPVLADALATAVLVLGGTGGLELIEHTPDAEALVVDASGELHFSRSFRELTSFEPTSGG
jgi:thiamine biosynthesis lipoprotein